MPKISIPSVSSPLAPDMRAFVQRVREALSLFADGVITRDDLVRASIIAVTPGGQIVPGDAVGDTDYTPPPAASNLVAVGKVGTNILAWDEPTYSNHSYTEIWRNTVDNLGTAAKVGSTDSFLYADAVGDGGVAYYYWVRFVSTADVIGPYNATAGTPVTSGQAGTDYFADLSVVTAKIANLAVTNSKIGGYIQSTSYVPGSTGWIINKDGTVEFNNATIRGGVWAGSVSSTAGVTMGAGGHIKGGATAYATGTGIWMGYDGGAYKFSLGAAGGARLTWDGSTFTIYDSLNQVVLASGSGVPWSKVSGAGRPADNATVGATFGVNIGGQITASNVATYIANAAIDMAKINGDIYGSLWGASGGTQGWYLQRDGNLYCANAYVRGDVQATSLNAATGTFSGTMTAAAVNAVNTINLAGNAVTVPVAATGTLSATTASADFGGQPVVISAVIFLHLYNNDSENSATLSGQIRVSRDGSNIAIRYWSITLAPLTNTEISIPLIALDNPGAGSHYYSIDQPTQPPSGKSSDQASIVVLGVKR